MSYMNVLQFTVLTVVRSIGLLFNYISDQSFIRDLYRRYRNNILKIIGFIAAEPHYHRPASPLILFIMLFRIRCSLDHYLYVAYLHFPQSRINQLVPFHFYCHQWRLHSFLLHLRMWPPQHRSRSRHRSHLDVGTVLIYPFHPVSIIAVGWTVNN